jgi:uncharacterized membrane protein
MWRYLTGAAGLSVVAGLAVIELALAPAVVVGSAATLAPKYLRRLRVPRTQAKPQRTAVSSVIARSEPAAERPAANTTTAISATFGFKQAVVKTITFRAVVTTLDFTTNYIVIGEFATAAGLSTFNLIAGPVFYLAHEAVWNYWGPSATTVDVPTVALPQRETLVVQRGWHGITISRALAKTVTFRTIASVMDFTTNYVVVGNAATAAGLSAFGFFLGPFVYYGHEKVWEYFGAPTAAPRESISAEPPRQRE